MAVHTLPYVALGAHRVSTQVISSGRRGAFFSAPQLGAGRRSFPVTLTLDDAGLGPLAPWLIAQLRRMAGLRVIVHRENGEQNDISHAFKYMPDVHRSPQRWFEKLLARIEWDDGARIAGLEMRRWGQPSEWWQP